MWGPESRSRVGDEIDNDGGDVGRAGGGAVVGEGEEGAIRGGRGVGHRGIAVPSGVPLNKSGLSYLYFAFQRQSLKFF